MNECKTSFLAIRKTKQASFLLLIKLYIDLHILSMVINGIWKRGHYTRGVTFSYIFWDIWNSVKSFFEKYKSATFIRIL